MIDFTVKQQVYNALQAVRNDSRAFSAICEQASKELRDALKQVKKLQASQPEGVSQELQQALDSLTLESTDSEVRLGARALLIGKLRSREISATEFGQFKDVFGLANASDLLTIDVTDYKDVVTDCPACGAHVYSPLHTEPVADSADDA